MNWLATDVLWVLLTQLMSGCKGSLQAIIFYDRATAVWITNCSHISHPKSITCLGATKILRGGGRKSVIFIMSDLNLGKNK